MSKADDDELGQLSTNPRKTKVTSQPDRLELPHGAFIALRQSGGLRFSTREVIVYTAGRVAVQWQGKLGAGEGTRHITASEIADLKEALRRSGLFDLPHSIGQPSPDGYAYELSARLGRRSKTIELFEGAVPAEMSSLLAQLKTLMTLDEA